MDDVPTEMNVEVQTQSQAEVIQGVPNETQLVQAQDDIEDDTQSEADGSDDDSGETSSVQLQLEYDEHSDNNSWHSEELKTPISTDDEDDGKAVFPIFNPNSNFGDVHLELGMEFENTDLFKEAVRDYTIHLGREIKWLKNDSDRCRARCKEKECEWMIYCSWSKVTKSFQIKTFVSEHSCSRVFKNSQAKTKWVSKKLEAKIREQPTITYVQAFEYLKKDFGVYIDATKLFRSLKDARKLVEGDVNKQYAKIWDYAHELLRSNPGSTARIDCIPIPNAPPQFQRFYVCLEACKIGFKAGCRPFIGLDGCFLKGYYGGQLLAAVGQDANNQNFCIAYAIVEAENKDNWKWFLTLLRQDLGDCRQHGWNFMSDMQKGLIAAVHEVFVTAPHRYCVMHLWRNFIKQWKDLELRGVVWQCARATTPAQFNAVMERLKVKNENAWSYLNKWPKEAWTKAYCSTDCKIHNITNNVCEGFNASILKYMAKPILTLAEEIRCYIMRTMSSNKLKLLRRRGPLCPAQHSRLDKLKIESNKWTPQWSGDGKYEVYCNWKSHVNVDLEAQTCTYRFWQLTGMLCEHVIACIGHQLRKPEDFCHGWLTLGSYNATYEHLIRPTQGEEYWEPTPYDRPTPAPLRRRPGRPKKKRRKDNSENPSQTTKLKRSYPIITFQRCGHEGHNTNGCCSPGVPHRPPNWIPPTVEESNATATAQASNATAIAQAPFGFGQGTFAPASMPFGVRPPPIRGTCPRPIMVPCPIQPNPNQNVMMAFIPTPRLPTIGRRHNQH